VRLREEGSGARKEIVDQIIALSKEFGVLTPYTAYFVPEPGTDGDGVLFGGGSGGGGTRTLGVPAAPAGTAAAPLESLRLRRAGESATNASQDARGKRLQNQVGNLYSYANKAGTERARDERLAGRVRNVAARTFYQVGRRVDRRHL
jgi:hypothetical protein